MTDRGEFMRQLKDDQSQMKSDELDELLGVAKIAGINVKDPSQRLNKFEPDIVGYDNVDDEDLDLSI